MSYEDNKDLYVTIEEFALDRNYEELFKLYKNFLYAHFIFIVSKFKFKNNMADRLYNFLKQCDGNNKNIINIIKRNYCTKDDELIWSDINLAFMNIASRYIPTNRNFNSYLCNTFYYELGRIIFKNLKEVLEHNGAVAYLDINNANLFDYKDNVDYRIDYICGYETIDRNLTWKWVSSKDEFSIFKDFNIKEKEIMALYYLGEYADKNIASYLNFHINTINITRRNAVNKLSNMLNIEHTRTRRTLLEKKRSISII